MVGSFYGAAHGAFYGAIHGDSKEGAVMRVRPDLDAPEALAVVGRFRETERPVK